MVRATGHAASTGAGCPDIGAAIATIGSTDIIGRVNKLSDPLVKSLGPWAEFPFKGGSFGDFREFHGVVKNLVGDDSLQFRNVSKMRAAKSPGCQFLGNFTVFVFLSGRVSTFFRGG
jgi:hypothetical protein